MRGMLGVLLFSKLPLPDPLATVLSIGVLIAMAVALVRPILLAIRTGDTAALISYGRDTGRFLLRVAGIIALFVGLAAVLLLTR